MPKQRQLSCHERYLMLTAERQANAKLTELKEAPVTEFNDILQTRKQRMSSLQKHWIETRKLRAHLGG